MKVASNRVGDIRKFYAEQLTQVMDSKQALFLTDSVIAFYVLIPRLQIAINLDKRIGESLMLKIHFAIKDLLRNKPLQYVLGETEFCGLDFYVNENVLIPRPETEELVELIVKEGNKEEGSLCILDIGTGSACIAVSLAHSLQADIYAVDISSKALVVARQNANRNDVKVNFIQQDVLDESKFGDLPADLDVIVSNPPYVRNKEKEMMQANVLDFEPDLALFVEDENALVFYKAISKLANQRLKSSGTLWFEINEYLSEETKLVVSTYFRNVVVINDYKGQARFIKAQGPK